MIPSRLAMVLASAMTAASLTPLTAAVTRFIAVNLLTQRFPLAGCAVTCMGTQALIVVVGRN